MSIEGLLSMSKINIAIDGYSGTGKSSTARQVADRLGYTYVDSGAMYRATTLFLLQNKVDLSNEKAVEAAISNLKIDFKHGAVLLNGENVSDAIRGMEVSSRVSLVSSYKRVREAMVAIQRRIGENKGVTMDGRDIGTVVFPDAELKIFMTADIGVRARRRQAELLEKGFQEELSIIQSNLQERDHQDSSRAESPLRKADHAIELDTSDLTFDDQVNKIVELAKAMTEPHDSRN